jgi:hypothetical protein
MLAAHNESSSRNDGSGGTSDGDGSGCGGDNSSGDTAAFRDYQWSKVIDWMKHHLVTICFGYSTMVMQTLVRDFH